MNVKKIIVVAMGMCLAMGVSAKKADPVMSRGAQVPYERYDSQDAKLGGKAEQIVAKGFDYHETASEATNQEYVVLHTSYDFVEWKINKMRTSGVTVRFTLPDNASGESVGQTSKLAVYVNDEKVDVIDLNSRWAWQYFRRSESMPQLDVTDFPMMRFDEVHFRLKNYVNKGDKITLRKAVDDGLDLGIDFIEVEEVPPMIPQGKMSLNVKDYGAVGDGVHDDMPAFRACIAEAAKTHRAVYVPEGTFALDSLLCLFEDNIYLMGAGMWYSNIYFTNNGIMKGGICANASNLHVSGLYINGINTSRQERNGDYRDYKAIWGNFGTGSTIEGIWSEHFECGIWIAGYYAPIKPPTDGLRVSNCRLRNHYADGLNFAEGTSNSVLENTTVRNCGDDGIASWSQTHKTTQCNKNNVFRNCTVELGWRAGGIGIFGGEGHEITNCLVSEMMLSAGIRFTADFPGCSLSATPAMKVKDCTLYRCGTTQDLFNNRLGAIDIHGGAQYPLDNIQFENIDIIESQADAIQLWGGNQHGNTLKNITVSKVGLGYKFQKKMPKPYGVAVQGGGSAEILGITVKGAKLYDKKQKDFDLKIYQPVK